MDGRTGRQVDKQILYSSQWEIHNRYTAAGKVATGWQRQKYKTKGGVDKLDQVTDSCSTKRWPLVIQRDLYIANIATMHLSFGLRSFLEVQVFAGVTSQDKHYLCEISKITHTVRVCSYC